MTGEPLLSVENVEILDLTKAFDKSCSISVTHELRPPTSASASTPSYLEGQGRGDVACDGHMSVTDKQN